MTAEPGARLPEIVEAVKSGRVKALVALGENPGDLGLTAAELSALPAFIVMSILSNVSAQNATVVLPSFTFAEKRGSMINGKGRLQRLNRAVAGPGLARDDWEILRDLIQAYEGKNSETNSRAGGTYSIEDVFREMSGTVAEFAGLSLSKIGDLGVQVMEPKQDPFPPSEPA